MTNMEDDQDDCNTELTLAIGSGHSSTAPSRDHLQSETDKIEFKRESSPATQEMAVEQEQKNSDRSVHKRKHDAEQDGNNDVRSTSYFNGYGFVTRKKIKYHKDEIGILEKTMNEHHTITATIRRDLACKLHKTERQIEVWFQNRRARDKLKRTEDEYEFLKRCCLTLTQENNKLKEDLQEQVFEDFPLRCMEDNQDNRNTELILATNSGNSSPKSEVGKIEFERKSSPETQEMAVERVQKNSDRLEQDGNNDIGLTSSCNRDGSGYIEKKKIKYNEEEILVLEKTMNKHQTITAAIRNDLAAKLNKTERQIEVWFQNRRTRDKLKRVEDEYEFLKRCCLTLSQENKKLKEEVQELRSVNSAATPTNSSSPRSTEGRPSSLPSAGPDRDDDFPINGYESGLDERIRTFC